MSGNCEHDYQRAPFTLDGRLTQAIDVVPGTKPGSPIWIAVRICTKCGAISLYPEEAGGVPLTKK